MERTLTIDLPLVAKVVKRHLVYPSSLPSCGPEPSSSLTPPPPQRFLHHTPLQQQQGYSFNTHHLLPSGFILDDLYKWTAHVEHVEQQRQRTQSISLPATRSATTDPLLRSLKQPGGFRRHFVLTQALQQGKRPPNFVTSSFVEFLCLYGHLGEDLSDTDDLTSSDDDDDDGHNQRSSSGSSDGDSYREDEQQEEGNVVAYGGPLLHQASFSSSRQQQHQQEQQYGSMGETIATSSSILPSPVVSSRKGGDHHQPLQYRHLHARETMPLLSRSRPGQTLQGKATPGKAMFLLLKSFVTTGNVKSYTLLYHIVQQDRLG